MRGGAFFTGEAAAEPMPRWIRPQELLNRR
jgi:hypothetical protein